MPLTGSPPTSMLGNGRAGSMDSATPTQAGNGMVPAASSASAAMPSNAKMATGKKANKARKPTDPSETEKLLAAKINQLELDAAGEKDQEQEIEREVKKATRDLNNLLAGMGTPMERMEALQKRIADLMADMKRVEREHVKGKKRADALQKERDAQRVELTKTNSVKEKLEKLAREFTKENKKLKEDVKRLEENERRMRDAGFARDAALTAEHDFFMETNRKLEPSKSFLEVDDMFRQKFKSFFDQYNLRELHFLSVLRQKDDEIQHHLARLENQKKVADSETTRARQLTTQVSSFSQTETELRSQLNIYVEKFKQVEDTLNNSNDLFLTFRKEMEEMSKKTKRLEKENLTLTRKHDATKSKVLELAGERTTMQRDLDGTRRKMGTLESIIRHMQEQGRDPGYAGVVDGAEFGLDRDHHRGARDVHEADRAALAAGSLLEVAGDDAGTESDYDDEDSAEDDDGDDSEDLEAPVPAALPKSRTYQYPPPSAASQQQQPRGSRGPGGRGVNGVNGTGTGGGGRGQKVEV